MSAIRLIVALLAGAIVPASLAYDYFPPPECGGGWRRATPAELGVDAAALAAAREFHNGEPRFTRKYGGALLIIHKGHLIAEDYVTGTAGGPQPWTSETCNDIKSSTKSVFGTVAGVFLEEYKDRVTLETRLVGTSRGDSLIPQIWDQTLTDERKQAIRVKHALSMTSGHAGNEPWNAPAERRHTPGHSGAFQMFEYCFGWWTFDGVPGQAKLLFEPGKGWNYSNFGLELLALAMRNLSDCPLGSYAYDRVLGPIGLPQALRENGFADLPYENRNLMNFSPQPGWGIGGGVGCDAYGGDRGDSPYGTNTLAGSALRISARDFARIAYLWLRRGRWEHRQLVPASWLELATRRFVRDDGTAPKEYGYTFWILDSWDGVPRDAFMSRGSDLNDAYVIPSLDLVVVRQGNEYGVAAPRDAFRRTLLQKIVAAISPPATVAAAAGARVWEEQEIVLNAAGSYANPYTEVDAWLDLRGPGFAKRVRGFWDGGSQFKVRIVATTPGTWKWTSGSDQNDAGLNGKQGRFEAAAWTEAEKRANPNRRGFVRATANGHALSYADGTPFFLFGDTWWSAGTRIWSWGNAGGAARISFQDAVARRKAQGYNGLAMIAAFPNWAEDGRPATLKEGDVVIRQHGWTTQDMVDENGVRPFALRGGGGLSADYERIQPAYFQSLDRKMRHLAAEGFVPFFETVRRDHGQSWKAYTPDWERSFARYVNYLAARYGSQNLLFSVLHYDAPSASLPIEEWRSAVLTYHRTYGLPPFDQLVTALTSMRTDHTWGHGADAPWLQVHGVGNSEPRNNRYAQAIFDQFMLENPLPTLNQEPVYPGWGKTPRFSLDDDYPPRCMAWSCVLQGGLAGHIYGAKFFDGKDGVDGLTAAGSDRLPVLKTFMLSEGAKYQDLVPTRRLASTGFEGSAVFARTSDARLLMAYFQRGAAVTPLSGLLPGHSYCVLWFDPRNGSWSPVGSGIVMTDASGTWLPPHFPNDDGAADTDWALKLTATGH